MEALDTALHVEGFDLDVAGVALHTMDVGLNTALAAGSDPIKLAAKLHGYCELHAWVDGPDRAWLAGIMQEGLDIGLYRRGIWYSKMPDGPRDQWTPQGWEDVITLLRARDDEPVVTSYTVCDGFPNPEFGWMQPWPDGVPKTWDALSDEQQQERTDRSEAWYDLDHDERWRISMEALRSRPGGQLSPSTLADAFGPGVTVYDLLAQDRDERVRAAVMA